jgi:hypothetical protein
VARDASAAVFEGTVVDRRITLVFDGVWFPAPEQDIVVRRVWKVYRRIGCPFST